MGFDSDLGTGALILLGGGSSSSSLDVLPFILGDAGGDGASVSPTMNVESGGDMIVDFEC